MPATATYLGRDDATLGTWPGVYGSAGHYFLDSPVASSLPAEVAVTGADNFAAIVWNADSGDTRAVRRPDPDATRVSATWYQDTAGTHFKVAVAPGYAVDMAVYAWDVSSEGRGHTFDVIDDATLDVLDSRNLFPYSAGVWMRWRVSGTVRVGLTLTNGPNFMWSAVMFDNLTAPGPAFRAAWASPRSRVLGAY